MLGNQIEILYEDNDLLVINKPAGLIVHADGKRKEQSVADWMAQKYPESAMVGEPLILSSKEEILRSGIVHRLDRETSGALLLAKNAKAYSFLKKQFQDRDVAKEYYAFVHGKIKNDDGVIDRPIGRSRSDFRKWSAQRFARGELREAITEYKVVARGENFTFLEVRPKTGRTHQIRVHFKAINHPVVCDKLYSPKQKAILGFERLALHARSIEFKKLDGESVAISAPYPQDFKYAMEKVGVFPNAH